MTVVAGLLVASGCAGGSDDAATPRNTLPSAAVEVVPVAPPDTAAVTDFVDTIPRSDPIDPPSTETTSNPDEIEIVGFDASAGTVAALNAALDVYEESAGVEITYVGSFDTSFEIGERVATGDAPDIAFFAQPLELLDLAREGAIAPVTPEVASATRAAWPADIVALSVGDDGVQYGVPIEIELRSLVWYLPDVFDVAGEPIPETLAEFESLVDRSAAESIAPLCVGIESGAATGWVFTDWVEDFVLREHGTEIYDQWVANEIPFDDPRIVESMQRVLDLWSGNRVFAAGGTIAETGFDENAEPLLAGNCLMHRQAPFFETYLPDGTGRADGSPEAIDVFGLPYETGRSEVIWSTSAAAFDDSAGVTALLEHLSSAAFADDMQRALGDEPGAPSFLSLAAGQDLDLMDPLDRRIADIAFAADSFRFDASDQMPSEVGAGTFWDIGTDMVNGDLTAEAGAALIEAAWPS